MNFVKKVTGGFFGGVWFGLRKTVFTFGNKRPRRLCYAVGLYTIGYNIYDMSYATVVHNQRAPIDYADVYGKGTWVVISGAADPIGQEYAKSLAKLGFNLVLVDQSQSGLDALKSELDSSVSVQTFQFDFQKSDEWTLY